MQRRACAYVHFNGAVSCGPSPYLRWCSVDVEWPLRAAVFKPPAVRHHTHAARPSRRIISVSSRSVRVVLKLESTQRSTRQSVVGVLYDCVCAVTRTPADAHAHGRTCYHPGRSSGRSNPGTETRWPAGRLFETMA